MFPSRAFIRAPAPAGPALRSGPAPTAAKPPLPLSGRLRRAYAGGPAPTAAKPPLSLSGRLRRADAGWAAPASLRRSSGEHLAVLVVFLVVGLERPAGGVEERLLQRRRAEAALEGVGRLEREQPPAVEDPDPLGQRLRLGEVMCAEQDRRVVARPDLADELLHLELRARVEAGRRLVEQQDDRGREQGPRESDLLLHASREALHRLVAPVRRESHPPEDLQDEVACLARSHAVVARRVAQVLGGRHLLEERRLDRNAVDEPAHCTRVPDDVVAEDLRRASVGEQQGGEQADERRLPG